VSKLLPKRALQSIRDERPPLNLTVFSNNGAGYRVETYRNGRTEWGPTLENPNAAALGLLIENISRISPAVAALESATFTAAFRRSQLEGAGYIDAQALQRDSTGLYRLNTGPREKTNIGGAARVRSDRRHRHRAGIPDTMAHKNGARVPLPSWQGEEKLVRSRMGGRHI
jgi:hypothetical protein